MSRFFNTTGPCNPEKHYILPPEAMLVRAMGVTSAEEAIERTRAYFLGKEEIQLAIVYGSAAKKGFNERSDIDVAVSGASVLDRDLLMDMAAELSEATGREVDMIDLHRAEGLILYRVMTEGQRVKTDRNLAVKFGSKALGYREDFKPLQDMMRDARIRRFIHGS
jgi:predicted nucleotidyltransferase